MKKNIFIAMMLLFSVTFTNCAAKKTVQKAPEQTAASTQTANSQQAYLDSLRTANEIIRAEAANKAIQDSIRWAREKDSIQHAKEIAARDKEVTTYNVPCVDLSYDDEDFFRDYGVGNVEGGNEQLARERASQAAKDMIKKRLGEYIQGMTDYYLESYSSNKSEKDAAGNRARTKLNGVVEGMLRNADKVCEKIGVDAKGNTKVYYTIEIPKKELNKKLMDVMSEDEKLRRDFNAEQMQKFMDERMQSMLEAKKAAGY